VKQRALVSGAGEMAIGLGFALLALAGGYLIAAFSYGAFFALSLILTVVGTGLFWLFFKSSSRAVIAASE
jgi:predicted MFS family arabinose efflux permease